MLGPILISAGTVVAGILGYAATRPNGFRYSRSTHIDAPADKVFATLNDFHHWSSWSPWEELDPNMNRTHSGAASGKGAVYEWNGNKKVGRGRMEITTSTPSQLVGIKLDFLAPFEAHHMVEFTLTPSGAGTDVTWTMIGTSPFVMKVMSIFMNMEKMIGKDFEKGLAKLKATVERG